MDRSIASLEIKGFKSIRDMKKLPLRSLNVLIGANGSGKSNFISFFTLLSEMLNGRLQGHVGRAGGAEPLLYQGSKVTQKIGASLLFGNNGYRFGLEPTVDDKLMFSSEKTLFAGVHGPNRQWSPLGTGHFEARVGLPTLLRPSEADYVVDAVKSWKVYHFHDTSPNALVKRKADIDDNEALAADARNLAPFLYRLKLTEAPHYEAIRDAVRQVAPFFDDFYLERDGLDETKIALRWTEKGLEPRMGAHQMSDGTLRFACLATLLLQPSPPATVIVDEPELGLHPYAITLLASMVRAFSERRQIIVSTQSVPLVNEFEAEDLIVVDREDGQSVFRRPDESQLKDWIEDYSLGELWEKNVLGGRPSR